MRAHPGRSARSTRRDHRPRRSQDGHQWVETLVPTSTWPTLRIPHHPRGATSRKVSAIFADAVRGTITYTNPKNGKVYAPKKDTAVLFVRPRGWHLDESHVTVNGKVASGSLFDFGLYFYHNVNELSRKGTGPYFYIPKLEGYLEARLWNDVFVAAQQYLGVPLGTIRATVLLETITAAFEMEEVSDLLDDLFDI